MLAKSHFPDYKTLATRGKHVTTGTAFAHGTRVKVPAPCFGLSPDTQQAHVPHFELCSNINGLKHPASVGQVLLCA
jgi:hypothetical protein